MKRAKQSPARKYDGRAELLAMVEAMEEAVARGKPCPTIRQLAARSGPSHAIYSVWRKENPDLETRLKAAIGHKKLKKTISENLAAIAPSATLADLLEANEGEMANACVDINRAVVLAAMRNPAFAKLVTITPGMVYEENEAIHRAYFSRDPDGTLRWNGDAKELTAFAKAREGGLKWLDILQKFAVKMSHSVTDATIRTEEPDPIESMSDEELEEKLRARGISHTGKGVVIDAWVRNVN